MTSTTKRRVARKARRCDSCERTQIEVGHVYLQHTLYPGNDIRDNTTPERHAECADCAGRYGREFELGYIPPDQPYRYWLGDERPQPADPLEGAA